MAENSETSMIVLENGIAEDRKNITQDGDAHVAEAHPLENGDIKKIPEKEPSTSAEEVTVTSGTENITNVAQKQEAEIKIGRDKVGDNLATKNHTEVTEAVIKDGIEITRTFAEKENESKINDEIEGSSHEIVRSFDVVNLTQKTAELNESKNDEIVTLQEVTLSPPAERNGVRKNPEPTKKMVNIWDTKKTVFFYVFLFAFVVWIVAYYAFDTGLIPNDKPSKK